MTGDLSDRERALRAEVRHVLRVGEEAGELAALAAQRRDPSAAGPPDPRPLYRLLGARRLLAVHWPEAYGGRGGTPLEHALVVEELIAAGVPDTLHTLSVQIVGTFLLSAGTAAQRATLLPALAAGERCATVLYSEPDVGSDLAALSTRAEPQADAGFLVSGRKVYSVLTTFADVGLCAVRDAERATPYEGVTLLLVPLDAPGVRVETLGSVGDEPFADVTLDRVRVGPDAVVGQVGAAWPLITDALALERTGIDHAAKARRWLDAGIAVLGEPADDALVGIGRLHTMVEASRLLALRSAAALGALQGLDPVAAAATKWWCSETARRVAWWGAEALGTAATLGSADGDAPADGLLEAAYREAPGLTISAGTSEVMLELIAASGLPEETGWT